MRLRRLAVHNFKSFRELDIEFGPLTVLIGTNASGKSNLLHFLQFIRDVARYGLRNAISMQGGPRYLTNQSIGISHPLTFRLYADHVDSRSFIPYQDTLLSIRTRSIDYSASIKFTTRHDRVRLQTDRLTLHADFNELSSEPTSNRELRSYGHGTITLDHHNTHLTPTLKLPDPLDSSHVRSLIIRFWAHDLAAEQPLLELNTFIPMFPMTYNPFSAISIYDFDTKLLKRAVPITGKTELEEDGSNLPIVLHNILSRSSSKTKFLRIVRDLLPFVVDFSVERVADKSLLFKVSDTYASNAYLPASLMSDGTVNIAAMIAATHFDESPIVVIEEPEKNLHPKLMSRLVNLLHDASANKQIIVTTHDPQILKHVPLEFVHLVMRDIDGFSTITRPVDRDIVKEFLAKDIGIDDLYIQDLLGI